MHAYWHSCSGLIKRETVTMIALQYSIFIYLNKSFQNKQFLYLEQEKGQCYAQRQI